MTQTLNADIQTTVRLPQSKFSTQSADVRLAYLVVAALAFWAIAAIAWQTAFLDARPQAHEQAFRFARNTAERTFGLLLATLAYILCRRAATTKEGSVFALSTADKVHVRTTIIAIVFASLSFAVFQCNFMMVKTTIPAVHPFSLDVAFHKADLFLGAGQPAYVRLSGVLDNAFLIKLIDHAYTIWSSIVLGAWILCWVSRKIPSARRHQYIIATLLVWFGLGNVAATLLSSAGPVYFGEITGDARTYAPLLDRLAQIGEDTPLNAVEYHNILWQMFAHPEYRMNGISAMPSLHVATTLLLLLLAWPNRIARTALIAYNLAIFIGSIVLAWHYAVDGLVSIALVLPIWWLAGRLAIRVKPVHPKTLSASSSLTNSAP